MARPLQTIGEAEKRLRIFDDRHWRHGPGVPSILHVRTHLDHSLATVLVLAFELSSNYPLDDGLRCDGAFQDFLPGRLIEYAFRLARHLDRSAEESLLAEKNIPPDEWVRWLWGEERERILSERPTESFYRRLYLRLVSQLQRLHHVCERLEHGEPLDDEKKKTLLFVVSGLLTYAIRFGKLGEEPVPPAEEAVARFLVPFAQRLEELEQRFNG